MSYGIEAELGLGVSLLEVDRSGPIMSYGIEAELGLIVSLLGSLAPPLDSLLRVLGHTLAFVVPEPEAELRLGVPLLG